MPLSVTSWALAALNEAESTTADTAVSQIRMFSSPVRAACPAARRPPWRLKLSGD
jgi:hypothetical protein